VLRPPRGEPEAEFASHDGHDAGYPKLAPSADTMKLGQSVETDKDWAAFGRNYRAEMNARDASRNLDLLATLSHQPNFAVGVIARTRRAAFGVATRNQHIHKVSRTLHRPGKAGPGNLILWQPRVWTPFKKDQHAKTSRNVETSL
jgi:uncharacterized protein YeaO (DUF488 family)